MFEIGVFLMMMLCLGLVTEKAIHVEYSLEDTVNALKKDIKRALKILFTEPKVRHTFDVTLANDIQVITKPYAKKGFEIKTQNGIVRNVPTIGIRFVPDHELDDGEMQELTRLLRLKFKEYVQFYNLKWNIFARYTKGTDYTFILLYYAEWEEDMRPFLNLYRQEIRKAVDKNGGVLRDTELEEELRHVH